MSDSGWVGWASEGVTDSVWVGWVSDGVSEGVSDRVSE